MTDDKLVFNLVTFLAVLALVGIAIWLASKHLFGPSQEFELIAKELQEDFEEMFTEGEPDKEIIGMIRKRLTEMHSEADKLTSKELDEMADEMYVYMLDKL